MTAHKKIEEAEASSLALPSNAEPRTASRRQAEHGHASPHPYIKKLERVLARMGDLYTVQDILSAIARNEMQSFTEGESWALTRIALYPRVKVVEVLAVVGQLDEARILHDRICIFAAEVGASVIQAYGRTGWMPDAKRRGWKVIAENYVYQRDIEP